MVSTTKSHRKRFDKVMLFGGLAACVVLTMAGCVHREGHPAGSPSATVTHQQPTLLPSTQQSPVANPRLASTQCDYPCQFPTSIGIVLPAQSITQDSRSPTTAASLPSHP